MACSKSDGTGRRGTTTSGRRTSFVDEDEYPPAPPPYPVGAAASYLTGRAALHAPVQAEQFLRCYLGHTSGSRSLPSLKGSPHAPPHFPLSLFAPAFHVDRG